LGPVWTVGISRTVQEKMRGEIMRAETVKISVNITKKQVELIDKLVEKGIYADRSEAVRNAINLLIEKYTGVLQ